MENINYNKYVNTYCLNCLYKTESCNDVKTIKECFNDFTENYLDF